MGNKIATILFAMGIICIAAGIALGEGKAGIFIIFPFIYGNGLLMLAGILLVFISFPVFMFSQFRFADKFGDDGILNREEMRTERHAGGLILIGPIPIVISSDWKTALILMAIGIGISMLLFGFIFSQL